MDKSIRSIYSQKNITTPFSGASFGTALEGLASDDDNPKVVQKFINALKEKKIALPFEAPLGMLGAENADGNAIFYVTDGRGEIAIYKYDAKKDLFALYNSDSDKGDLAEISKLAFQTQHNMESRYITDEFMKICRKEHNLAESATPTKEQMQKTKDSLSKEFASLEDGMTEIQNRQKDKKFKFVKVSLRELMLTLSKANDKSFGDLSLGLILLTIDPKVKEKK